MEPAAVQAACVRVLGPDGATEGTGFLVDTYGHILTCWHVVSDLQQIEVAFHDTSDQMSADLRLDLSEPSIDVAVLQVTGRRLPEPLAVDFEWRVGDPIWSFGYQYQQHFSAGYPVDGRISGDTRLRGQQLIVVANTDVQRGLSGGPVLNMRTGKVMAMMNAKLDDKGVGFAVPFKVVAQHWPALRGRVSTSAREFRRNVEELFLAMGYTVSEWPDAPGQEPLVLKAELRNGPLAIRVLIGCVESSGSIGGDQHRNPAFAVSAALVSRAADRGLIVTGDDGSAEFRALAASLGLQILSLADLERSLLDFSTYLEKVIHDFENFETYAEMEAAPVIEQFRWCDLYRYYVDPECTDPVLDTTAGKISEILEEFLAPEHLGLLAILGDYGTGKTSLCLQFTYRLACRYRDSGKQSRIPVFVPLRGLDVRGGGIRRLILDSLSTYGVQAPDFRAVEIMIKAGRLALIFDGFDEVGDALDRRGALEALAQIASLAALPGSKVVLTCRTHYFLNTDESIDILTRSRGAPFIRTGERSEPKISRVVELAKFTEPQILDLMQRHSDDYRSQWDRIRAIYNLADLARTPILLSIILSSLGPLLDTHERKIGAASLYDTYTKFWLERDDDRSESTPQQRLVFAHELAWRMYSTDQLAIPLSELEAAIGDHFGQISIGSEWLAKMEKNVRTCSFLARDRFGNFEFAHKSFMEFFVAQRFALDVSRWPEQNKLWSRIIPFEVVSFLREMLEPADFEVVKQISVDRSNDDILRSLCMDLQIAIGDPVVSEPLVFELRYDRTGDVIGCANADMCARVLDAQSLTQTQVLRGHHGWVRSLAFSPDNRMIATGSWDGRLTIWAVRDWNLTVSYDLGDRINAVTFTPDSSKIICAGYDTRIRILDVATGSLAAELHGHTESIRSIAIDPTGTFLVSASLDKTIRIWALDDQTIAPQALMEEEPVACLELSPDGKMIATGSWTGDLTLWTLSRQQRIWRKRAHSNMINACSFSPDGRWLGTASDDRSVRVWDCGNGSLVANLALNDFAQAVAFSPDGTRLVAGGYDCEVHAWECESFREVAWVALHSPTPQPPE